MPAKKYSRFRNSTNERLLAGLFIETRPTTQKSDPIYTLRDWDHTRPSGEFLPSLYLLYMASNDPTEYSFAEEHLDGWEHWLQLQECEWFKPYIQRWRKELELRIKSQSLARLQELAADPSNKSYTDINKFLATAGYKEKASKGRPSKKEIAAQTRELSLASQSIKDDYTRMVNTTTLSTDTNHSLLRKAN